MYVPGKKVCWGERERVFEFEFEIEIGFKGWTHTIVEARRI